MGTIQRKILLVNSTSCHGGFIPRWLNTQHNGLIMTKIKATNNEARKQSQYSFSFPEIDEMLKEIGCPYSVSKHLLGGWNNVIGIAMTGHPIVDMIALSEWIEAVHPEAKEMSLNEWLQQNSKHPIDKWKFYLGVE